MEYKKSNLSLTRGEGRNNNLFYKRVYQQWYLFRKNQLVPTISRFSHHLFIYRKDVSPSQSCFL